MVITPCSFSALFRIWSFLTGWQHLHLSKGFPLCLSALSVSALLKRSLCDLFKGSAQLLLCFAQPYYWRDRKIGSLWLGRMYDPSHCTLKIRIVQTFQSSRLQPFRLGGAAEAAVGWGEEERGWFHAHTRATFTNTVSHTCIRLPLSRPRFQMGRSPRGWRPLCQRYINECVKETNQLA